MTVKTKKANQKWPHNSELYMTIREINEAMPKLDFIRALRVGKPVKPNGHRTSTK